VLARERPDSIGYVGYLAAIDARWGNREVALRIAASLADMQRPYLLGEITFWHARIAAILGDYEAAVEYLHQADAEGRRFNASDEFNVDLQELGRLSAVSQLGVPEGRPPVGRAVTRAVDAVSIHAPARGATQLITYAEVRARNGQVREDGSPAPAHPAPSGPRVAMGRARP